MFKIFRYSLSDLLRSSWSYFYFSFYLILGFGLLFFNPDVSKSVITLMNIIVVFSSLIAVIFGIMYYYNSREFIELLLAQPIKRSDIFIGQYLAVSISLSLSLLLGVGIPFVIFGVADADLVKNFMVLMTAGIFLNFIFVAVAYNIALYHENRIKGFSYAILFWLFMTLIYDGLFLVSLIAFKEYPLEKASLAATLFNPIDLSRILILLRLDISALMGYTGAVFKNFFGTTLGFTIAFCSLLIWIMIPALNIYIKGNKKDF